MSLVLDGNYPLGEAARAHRAKMKRTLERRRQTMIERYGVESLNEGQPAKMVISDWYIDELGNRCRTVTGT